MGAVRHRLLGRVVPLAPRIGRPTSSCRWPRRGSRWPFTSAGRSRSGAGGRPTLAEFQSRRAPGISSIYPDPPRGLADHQGGVRRTQSRGHRRHPAGAHANARTGAAHRFGSSRPGSIRSPAGLARCLHRRGRSRRGLWRVRRRGRTHRLGALSGRQSRDHRAADRAPGRRAGHPAARRLAHAALRRQATGHRGRRRLTPGVAAPDRRPFRPTPAGDGPGGVRRDHDAGDDPGRHRRQRVDRVDGRPHPGRDSRALLRPPHGVPEHRGHGGLAGRRTRPRHARASRPPGRDARNAPGGRVRGRLDQRLASARPAGPGPPRGLDRAGVGRLRTLRPGRQDASAACLPARLARRGRHLRRILLVPHAGKSQDGLRARGGARDPGRRHPHRLGAGVGAPRRRIRRSTGARRVLVRHLGGASHLAVHHAGPAMADRHRSSAGRRPVGRAWHRDDGSVDRPGSAPRPSLLPGDLRHGGRPRLRSRLGSGRRSRLRDRRAGRRAGLDLAQRARALPAVRARPRCRRPAGRADRGAGGAERPRSRRRADRHAGKPVDAMPRGPAADVVSEGRASPRR